MGQGIRTVNDAGRVSYSHHWHQQARIWHVQDSGYETLYPALQRLEEDVIDEGRVRAFPDAPGALLLPELGDDLEERVGASELELVG